MSNTYKEKNKVLRRKQRKLDWQHNYNLFEVEVPRRRYNPTTGHYEDTYEVYTYNVRLQKAGVETKKPRNHLDPYHYWYRQTPGWWIREFMTVPKRRACREWQRACLFATDLEDVDVCPDHGRKPHKYYW